MVSQIRDKVPDAPNLRHIVRKYRGLPGDCLFREAGKEMSTSLLVDNLRHVVTPPSCSWCKMSTNVVHLALIFTIIFTLIFTCVFLSNLSTLIVSK